MTLETEKPPDYGLELDGSHPNGWALSTIGHCFLDIRNGTTAAQNNEGKGVPVTRIETIQKSRFDLGRVQHISEVMPALAAKFKYECGDIALSHINSMEHVGKTALYDGDPPILIHGMNLLRLRLGHDFIAPRYAHFYMQSDLFRNAVRDRVGQAVNQVSINQKNLREILIPVAPFAEQKRIVAKVEELLSRLNAARERLAKVPALLKRFRQSVLAAACSGRLTADLREANAEAPRADEHFKRLSLLRSEEYENAATRAKRFGHRPPKRPAFMDAAEVDATELPGIPELPDTWALLQIQNTAEIIQYGTSVKADAPASTGVPMLRMGNIQDGSVILSDLKYMARNADDVDSFRLTRGDIVFNRTNSPELVGKAGVFADDREMVFASYLIRLRCDPRLVTSDYVNYWINSLWGRAWARAVRTDGVSQSNINATKLGGMPLPTPPLEEQREIVHRVSLIFGIIGKMEARAAIGTARAEKMTQSILAKAFRGELVPTEAELAEREGREFETAAELLERVASQNAAPVRKRRSTRRKARSPA